MEIERKWLIDKNSIPVVQINKLWLVQPHKLDLEVML